MKNLEFLITKRNRKQTDSTFEVKNIFNSYLCLIFQVMIIVQKSCWKMRFIRKLLETHSLPYIVLCKLHLCLKLYFSQLFTFNTENSYKSIKILLDSTSFNIFLPNQIKIGHSPSLINIAGGTLIECFYINHENV